MDENNTAALQYPIGHFQSEPIIDNSQIQSWISQLQDLPVHLREAVAGLSDMQLDTAYRPGGWTLRQVVHHLADSHMNSYIRFKLAMTEDNPVIRPYFEDRWAECKEAKSAPVDISLDLLECLHDRWVQFLVGLEPADWERIFIHPERKDAMVLKQVLGLYVWHGKHHLAHILNTRKRNRW